MRYTLALLTALLLAPSVALRAVDGSKSTSDAAWPPEYMKALPADYLARLRHALQLESDRFDNPQFKKADVIKVRVAIAALALGQHVDELNAFPSGVGNTKPIVFGKAEQILR